MLISRLVFGCARLAGGASESASRRLVEQALAGGITHFDTAPSYGLGTAEQVVGRTVGSDPNILVTAKIGSVRPKHPLALTALRRARRLLPRRQADVPYIPVFPGDRHEPDGCFDLPFMEQSIEVTLANLRRQSVDYLLLHEGYSAPSDAVVSFLDGLVTDGLAGCVGFANSAVYDPALRAACPDHWAAQAAIEPGMLLGPAAAAPPVLLHSLVKTDGWLRARDGRYAAAADRAVSRMAELGDRDAIAALLPYCLAAQNAPAAKLIYATTDAARLAAVLAVAHAIEAGPTVEAIADTFAEAYAAAGGSAEG